MIADTERIVLGKIAGSIILVLSHNLSWKILFVLFCFVLFCFVLFCFVLFCLFCCVFVFVLFCLFICLFVCFFADIASAPVPPIVREIKIEKPVEIKASEEVIASPAPVSAWIVKKSNRHVGSDQIRFFN